MKKSEEESESVMKTFLRPAPLESGPGRGTSGFKGKISGAWLGVLE
jgi:hypothetical protein